MAIVVLVEESDGKIKKSSLEAIAYAAALNKQMNEDDVVALALGNQVSSEELESLGKFGANRVLHVTDERLNQGVIQAYASVVDQAMNETGAKVLVLAKSSLADPVASRVAIKQQAALGANVVDLPDLSDGFVVKRSIYTGKAFAYTKLDRDKKIIALRKNAITPEEGTETATVENFSATLSDTDFDATITNTEKSEGDILLPEADIVVSGGRGLKGPENWEMIEELADTLGAATGCSKPVSDMGWRPHHEHVGQTGVKVSPTLYVAVGISGAIQHLAGVNSSKYILVVNQDAEAPFFKAADYGVVGNAFEIVPQLTEKIKASQN
ncbi:MAG: electron transfer flavoprotein subunit alpha/FixB family protein [Tunicatimonas sp.]|uniref:electron transfer flavoprotein subunit alpha/FixB family protein n=1 Tax=Tunicatimonas sp. TaxID=1940096 RepID=UPI003C72D4A8